MNLELSDFNERIRLLRRIRSRGREDYLIGNQEAIQSSILLILMVILHLLQNASHSIL
ncbi:hypothetical protein MtrunA17_Chr3g0107441 [Medicago truncatula]|uniref:Uncharacterized protein n=1 Tax=Medicago truncatula TaxID=3880 RepID=A0A396IRA4_MEDTR|nr:hypothetical protein MtrunA17_Chr3g0107441 [Medicago truncatula]